MVLPGDDCTVTLEHSSTQNQRAVTLPAGTAEVAQPETV